MLFETGIIKRNITCNLLAFLLLTCHFSYCQTYNFDYYSVEDGLSQSTVNDIIQDKRGFLWIATAGGGVCKFDGSKFTQYSEQDGLSGDIATGLTQDSDHNIWITSTWGGITRYNGSTFYAFTKSEIPIISDGNSHIFVDSKGIFWIGSTQGLIKYDGKKFKKYTEEDNEIISDVITEITEDSKGNIWVGTNRGICIFMENKTVLLSEKDGLLSNRITSIQEDSFGNIFIGSDKGLTKLDLNDVDKKEDYLFEHILPNAIQTPIADIEIDKENRIWIATRQNGIFILNVDSSHTHLTKKNGLISDILTKLFLDHSGNIWIGTNGAGLMKYGNMAFSHFDKIKGLNNPSIFSISADNNSNIWVGTKNDGLFKYDGKTTTHYTTENGLNSNSFRSSLLDSNNNLWFATNTGLLKYKNGQFKNFTVEHGLPSNEIRSILLDKSGNLWIGTFGKGLSKYDFSSFTNYTVNDGLPNDYIHSLFQDRKGNIWIGTGRGVAKYDSIFTSYANEKGFCNSYIGSIAEDRCGNIWFGTDRCAVKYDGASFKSLTTKDGLTSNLIYLMYGDKLGKLWIGTNNGIDQISIGDNGDILKIKNFGTKQGFKGVECNSRAIFEDAQNNIWIGTIHGLVKYTPKHDKKNIFEPNIHINGIKLFFEDVNWLDYAKELTKWDNLPKNLVLDYDQNHLTFQFSATNLSFPDNLNYRFKLTPFDNQWFYPKKETDATYSNLPPGSYTFTVSARNQNGIWNRQPATYTFKISPPWWKKWWAIFLFTILCFYIIFKISSYREKQQLKVRIELEKKVKERTVQIESQRDEKEIMLKEIHHRVKNNMQVIISLLSIQSGYTKDAAALALFDEAKNRIRSMALIHEKMYQTGDLAHIDFKEYIESLSKDIINSYSINSEVSLDIKIDEVKFNIDMLIPLGLLLNEIISNALKYAFNNKEYARIFINLSYNKPTKEYTLIIGDNGSGMEMGTLEKEDGGLGIELIKVFVSQLDGTIVRLEEDGTFYKIDFAPQK